MTDRVKKIPRRIMQAIYASAWAISDEWIATADEWTNASGQEWLETVIGIAARQPKEPLEAVQARLGRPLSNGCTGAVQMRENGVAIIDVEGVIFRYANAFELISGGISTETLMLAITEAVESPEVRAIILNFDSPGGQVKGINGFANHIAKLSQVKPIVSYVPGGCMSAAYWIAAATNEIIADATAPLGSLGILARVDTSRSDAERGIVVIVSSQSPNKVLDAASDAGRSAIQREVDEYAEHMLASIATFRGVTPAALIAAGGAGGTKLGKSAVAAGLADRLGSLEELVAELGRAQRVAATSTSNQARKGHETMPKPKASPKSPTAAANAVAALAALALTAGPGGCSDCNCATFAASEADANTCTCGHAEANHADAEPEGGTTATGSVADLRAQITHLTKLVEDGQKRTALAESNEQKAQRDKLATEANAQVDAWEREGRLTGNATTEVRGYYVALVTGEPVTPEQFKKVVAALPQLDTSRIARDLQPKNVLTAPTKDDYKAADRGNAEARGKVDAYVRHLAATSADKTKTYAEHLKDARSAAFAAAK